MMEIVYITVKNCWYFDVYITCKNQKLFLINLIQQNNLLGYPVIYSMHPIGCKETAINYGNSTEDVY